MALRASIIGRPAAWTAVLACILWCADVIVGAADWPQFRGPTGQGHAPDVAVPLEWSETENVTWKSPVRGRGWSSPVIADGRIWLTTAVTDPRAGSSLRLLAYDVESGANTLDIEVFGSDETYLLNPKNSFASPTPVLDPAGERVYVHFGAAGTAAVSTAGDVLWRTPLPLHLSARNGGSPILHDGRLVVSIDGYDTAYLVAVDGRTGEERWALDAPGPGVAGLLHAAPHSRRNRDQIVNVSAFRTSGHDPATGREILAGPVSQRFLSNVPRPIYGHGLVYLSTGFQAPTLLAVRADGEGDVTRSHVAWRLRRGAPLTPLADP